MAVAVAAVAVVSQSSIIWPDHGRYIICAIAQANICKSS